MYRTPYPVPQIPEDPIPICFGIVFGECVLRILSVHFLNRYHHLVTGLEPQQGYQVCRPANGELTRVP